MGLPRVGILADDRLQQHLLKTALVHFGFDVVLTTDPERLSDLGPELQLDAWVVDIRHEEDENLHWLDELLEGDIPVLIGLEQAPQKTCPTFPKWEKKLYSKLLELTQVTPLLAENAAALEQLPGKQQSPRIPLPAALAGKDFSQQVATCVWVLGASLGGPEAVKAFLDALPAGLPVAFVYAQHIDPRFEESLSKTIGRHAEYRLKNFCAGEPLRCGEVLVAPIQHEFCFDSQSLPQTLGTEWPGPYGPSIDQVIVNVSRHYGRRAGYILFSGMGNDGAEAIVGLSDPDVPVWVQTPATCANSSMPESAIATRRVNYIGDPYQLALQLVNRVKHSWIQSHESISHENR